MASAGLNKWIVSGNLAADAQIKTVELRDGDTARVATATLYVQKVRNREESFIVRLSIWEKSYGWRKLPFLKKGSLIICTGNIEPNPYISSNGNVPKAGLEMTVLDIDLDIIRNADEDLEGDRTANSLDDNMGYKQQDVESIGDKDLISA
ncbi:MAG: single-stranded DNA-binding protein [Drouetiella hepatica Uher 2000/2452]|jgi:single-stranded DNA-binding protein|uniref:Single-stranded DNA-binding protein n=1 Tax=Drouetiella hepatica Uher 2000/2452 TaxID=904376 RepID=A0A951UMV7_9CYAN|nr:single-stranded DNA-binding protein [Drouetiella hepatica Uher 2000/2452]